MAVITQAVVICIWCRRVLPPGWGSCACTGAMDAMAKKVEREGTVPKLRW